VGAVGAMGLAADGTINTALHFGHFAFLPADVAGTANFTPQEHDSVMRVDVGSIKMSPHELHTCATCPNQVVNNPQLR
jgi:hypothetical protein